MCNKLQANMLQIIGDNQRHRIFDYYLSYFVNIILSFPELEE